jgi:small subunit ribosomal protein S18
MARKPLKPPAKDRRPIKKKTSILTSENIDWIDYKDVNLLRRFMSERAKVRARRVTGNSQQQQVAVARAIRVAREMALLPYSVRQTQQRSKGRRDRGDRGDRDLRDLEVDSTPISRDEREDASEVEELEVGTEFDGGEGEAELGGEETVDGAGDDEAGAE